MRSRLFIGLVVAGLSVLAQPADGPRYTSDGQMMRPNDYREWIYLSSGLGMTYDPPNSTSASASPKFDNVFVNPSAYKAFVATGTWPDKSMFALEIRNSASKGSINNGGHYQENVEGVEIHVKDSARFPGKWAFFDFSGTRQTAKAFPADSSCQTCHEKHGAVDQTFVQFYPTLVPIAKAKGTFHDY